MATDLIRDGEKYALIAVQTRSSVDVHPTEMAPGFWVSSTPMISIDAHWKEWLGSIRIEEIHNCNLFLMVKAKAGAPSVLDEENTRLENSVWQSYCGLLLADRFGVGQDPVQMTGARVRTDISVRRVRSLDAPIHADPYHQLELARVQEGARIGTAIKQFPWGKTWRFNRTLHLYIKTRSTLDWLDRLHQYARCLEGLTVPPISGGTGRNFAKRIALFVGLAPPSDGASYTAWPAARGDFGAVARLWLSW